MVDRIMADNPTETTRQGLHHFEYRTYQAVALLEALLNPPAMGTIAGWPRLVKQYSDRIEIGSRRGCGRDNAREYPRTPVQP